MTRETRIGLLVGLLFIIMFGLVLVPLTTKDQGPAPQQAPAPGAMASAAATPSESRDCVVVPKMGPAGPLADVTTPDPATKPIETVKPPETREVARVDNSTTDGKVEVQVLDSHGRDVSTGQPPTDPEIKSIEVPGTTVAMHDTSTGDSHAGAVPAGSQVYEVKPGDNLFRIARTVYGPTHASEHPRIMEANKDKITSPSALKVGMKLVIPPLPTAAPTAGSPTTRPAPAHERAHGPTEVATLRDVEVILDHSRTIPPLSAGAHEPATQPAPAAPVKSYVVKQGDTVAKIARTYKTSIDKIVKANSLKNPKDLKIGAKLDIPA